MIDSVCTSYVRAAVRCQREGTDGILEGDDTANVSGVDQAGRGWIELGCEAALLKDGEKSGLNGIAVTSCLIRPRRDRKTASR